MFSYELIFVKSLFFKEPLMKSNYFIRIRITLTPMIIATIKVTIIAHFLKKQNNSAPA